MKNAAYIKLHGVSVHAMMQDRDTRSIKLMLLNKLKLKGSNTNKFHPILNSIDIEFQSGDIIGLTGENGSGKTTLLKTIAGIISPNTGQVEIKGKVTCLLDNSAGFDENATGRKNIFLRGYTLGIRHQELLEKQNSIIELADLGEFIDQPVSKYSAGMRARLNFAVVSEIKTDILLLDEGIAVGDDNFRDQVQNKLDELLKNAGITIIATHDRGLIRRYCNKIYNISDRKLHLNAVK